MARDDEREIQRELRDARRAEPFTLGGRASLIKVLRPFQGAADAKDEYRNGCVAGYVAMESAISGLRPSEIAQSLGLEHGSLDSGCRVFALLRQPGPSEIEYDLTAEHPGGLSHTPYSDQRFPPGDRRIHQWKLKTAMRARLLCLLAPGERYVPRL